VLRKAKCRLREKHEQTRQRRFENRLLIGNLLYQSVRVIERNWRSEVIDGTTPYDPRDDASIMDFYRIWFAPSRRFLDEIRLRRLKKLAVEGADEFEANCKEASAILIGENPFYDDIERAGVWAARTASQRKSIRAVKIDESGRILEQNGERFVMPGLAPEQVRKALEDELAGRMRPLSEIIAARSQHAKNAI